MKKKYKILGEKYGIEITRPWNIKMYDHNDTIAAEMNKNIQNAIVDAYAEDNDTKLRTITKTLTYAYGSGYSPAEVFDNIMKEMQTIENYRLNEEYPELVKMGVVPELKKYMVGYDK